MTCEAFSTGSSFLHKADPRVKILCALAYSVVVACLTGMPLQYISFFIGAVLLAAARLPIRMVLRRLALVNLFVLALWFVIPFSTPGSVLFYLGPLSASSEGVYAALSITLKCNAILMANLALLSTSTIFSLAHSLAHLKVHRKLVQLFFFTWRYLHVLEDEHRRMVQAIKIRGFEPGTNMMTYRTYAYLVGLLFVRGYERGERVYKAMLCRGFDGTFWLLHHFHLHSRDIVLALVMGIITAGLAGMEWTGILH